MLIIANKSDLNRNWNKIESFLDWLQEYLNNSPYFIKECNINDKQSYKLGIDCLYSNLQ